MQLTLQHDRGAPIARAALEDAPDALRFRAELPPGARQDQALSDIRAGLLTGASVEYLPARGGERFDAGIRVVSRAVIGRLSVVDDPAFKQSRIEARSDREPRRKLFL